MRCPHGTASANRLKAKYLDDSSHCLNCKSHVPDTKRTVETRRINVATQKPDVAATALHIFRADFDSIKESTTAINFLVIVVIDIHRPNRSLIRFPRENGLDRKLGREHRMVLIVVPMHAVAADQKEIVYSVDPATQFGKIFICTEIRRICLRNTNYGPVKHVRPIYHFNLFQLPSGKCLHRGIIH